MNKEQQTDILRLLGGECEGDAQNAPAHTPQAEQTGEKVSEVPAAEVPSTPLREERFRELMEGEFKDLFTDYFQATFNRRFKEHKQMKEELESIRAVKTAAAERFGTEDTEALLAAIRADKQEKSVPTAASEQPSVTSPTPEQELAAARADACYMLLEQIRARGMRPAENGISDLPHATAYGAGEMTRAERAELARRAARGEQIAF